VSEISKDLGKRGIWVDQMTGLDPVGGTVVNIMGKDYVFGDPEMASYDNVIFVDDYFQTAGQPSGQSFDGAHVQNLSEIVDGYVMGGEHNAVPVYWVGTIDTSATTAGGMPIDSDWYGSTANKPARNATGYLFSRLGGGDRPADGLGAAFGGSASRKSAGQSGSQWANLTGASIVGGNSILSGTSITLKALYNDRDSGATISFFLDADRNPLNTNGAATLASKSLASVAAPTSLSLSGNVNVAAGTYYLGASITDADGHVRYVYNAAVVTVASPQPIASADAGVLTISGTNGPDAFNITTATVDGVAMIQITRNGEVQNVQADGITRIVLDTGDGDDTLSADASCPPMYAFGGLGNDSLSGGGGNDTLTGGAGKNTLMGNDGDDRLNGSGGRDLIFGGAGADRLYGNGGNDTLDGGGGVDRIWGGDGDDLMLGGSSNDKLYGEAGADTFKGQAGADLFGDVESQDSVIGDAGDTIVNVIV
jgi:Ca2+-binding RTX toxin-like protein